jgi:hypothetical protein
MRPRLLSPLAALFLAGPGADARDDPAQGAKPAAAEAPVEGTWTGTTSQGRRIEIRLKDSALDLIKLEWTITFEAPCPPPGDKVPRSSREGRHRVRFPYREAVKDMAFKTTFGIGRDLDASLSGTFGHDGSASGDLELKTLGSSPCVGAAKATWKAQRAGSEANVGG